ncbi:unnamed protein product [Xylocopa violacea]|uniref:Uncharacterized protein n=1 Tax=Xylocopa violacea TaxID=135666 RepID=A0ABP1NVX9_XYLVO
MDRGMKKTRRSRAICFAKRERGTECVRERKRALGTNQKKKKKERAKKRMLVSIVAVDRSSFLYTRRNARKNTDENQTAVPRVISRPITELTIQLLSSYAWRFSREARGTFLVLAIAPLGFPLFFVFFQKKEHAIGMRSMKINDDL